MPNKVRDLSGQVFNRLRPIKHESRKYKNKSKIFWLCECTCGNKKWIMAERIPCGHTKSCGCLKDDLIKSNTLERGMASKRRLLDGYKRNSKKRGIDFLLSFDDFIDLTSGKCYYCGVNPNTRFGNARANGYYFYNGIDRVNNNKGYIKENCVSCCKGCNRAKSDLSESDFASWIENVYKNFVMKEIEK